MLAAAVSLAAAVVLLIAMPGPAVVFLVGQTLAAGRRKAVLSMLGHTVGATALGLVIVLVLGAVLNAYPVVKLVLRVAGGMVLVWMGAGHIKTVAGRKKTVLDPQVADVPPPGRDHPFWGGFGVGVTNIKVIVVYTVIVPSFLPSGVNPILGLVALALVPTVVGVVCDLAWIQAAHLVRARLSATAGSVDTVMGVGGLILVGLGVATAAGLFE